MTKHFMELHDVAVHVKGSGYWWAGTAYDQIPPAARVDSGVRYLITIRISRKYNEIFPAWQWGYGEKFTWRGQFPIGEPIHHVFTDRILKTWPLLDYSTWQMAFVGLLAHEARHIQQFRYRRPTSEIECQWAAWYALRGVFGADALTYPTDPHKGLQRVPRAPKPPKPTSAGPPLLVR